jgi:biotin carboxylase
MTVQLALGDAPSVTSHDTGVRSAAVRFLLADAAGEIGAVAGTETLTSDPNVVEWEVQARPGQVVRQPADNSDYLGRVMVVDRDGPNARELAERAAARVRIQLMAGRPA